MDNIPRIPVKRRRGLIPEDLLNFRWLDEIAISPSGEQVAYSIRRPHVPSNGYVSRISMCTTCARILPGA